MYEEVVAPYEVCEEAISEEKQDLELENSVKQNF